MQLLSTNEAAAMLAVTVDTLRTLVNAGVLPVIRLSKRCWRFRRETLEEWLRKKEK